MKFSRQEYRNGLSFPFPGDLPDLGIKPVSHVVVVQSLSCVRLFATPWTAAYLFFTISQSLLTLIFIKLVMSFNHLILCRPLLLQPAILPSIRIFSSESVLHIRWPKYWSFSFSVSLPNQYSGLISLGLMV